MFPVGVEIIDAGHQRVLDCAGREFGLQAGVDGNAVAFTGALHSAATDGLAWYTAGIGNRIICDHPRTGGCARGRGVQRAAGQHCHPVERLEMRITNRSEEHTSELQSLMRISYAVFCLKKKRRKTDDSRKTT